MTATTNLDPLWIGAQRKLANETALAFVSEDDDKFACQDSGARGMPLALI